MPDNIAANRRTAAGLHLACKMLLAAAMCLGWINVSAAVPYYVATDGSNASAGTKTSPWRTIQFAADHAVAGDTVYVRQGVYRELVRLHRSGSQDRGFITLRNYPGETPVISGRGLPVVDGQSGLVTITNRDFIRIQGFRLTHYASENDSVPIGLYVSGQARHIELLHNRIDHIATYKRGCAGNALGIAVYGSRAPHAIRQLVIQGNEVSHLRTGCSESVAINGNVDGFEVSHNRIHDNNNIGIDIIGYEGTAPDARYDVARNGLVADNTVYNISSATNSAYPSGELAAGGIYVDGGKNIVIDHNFVYDNDIGIELASEHRNRNTRNVTVRNNQIWHNRTTGLSIGGYAAHTGGTVDCTIVANHFYKNDTRQTYGGEFQIQYHARRNVFKRNTMLANRQMVYINYYVDSTPRPVVSSHNRYYADTLRTRGEWQWRGRNYAGFEAYRRLTRNDRGSTFAVRGRADGTEAFTGLLAWSADSAGAAGR